MKLKLEEQIKLLKYGANRVSRLKTAIGEAIKQMREWYNKLRQQNNPDEQDIRLAEAHIGRIYWATLALLMQRYSPFDKRTRRPAQDPFNAMINYGYGMLYGITETAVLTAGLDPMTGILHREEYNRPAFVYDAIEPFRPWVDRLVIQLAMADKLKADCFEKKEDGMWLSKQGKQLLIPQWNEMMRKRVRFNGHMLTHNDQILKLMQELASQLLNDNLTDT